MGSACCNSKASALDIEKLTQATVVSPATPALTRLLTNLLTLPAYDLEEEKAKQDALSQFLEECPQVRKPCIKQLRTTAISLLNKDVLSAHEVLSLRLCIETIGELVRFLPLQSVAAIYELAALAVCKERFPALRDSLHRALVCCNDCQIEDISMVTQSFQSDLMDFCKSNPSQVTEKDIELLRLLIPVYARSSQVIEIKQTKWSRLIDFVLERLQTDVSENSENLVNEEKRFFADLCIEAMESEKSMQRITLKVLSWIQETALYGQFAEASLGVVVDTIVEYKSCYSAQFLKFMLDYASELLGNSETSAYIHALSAFIIRFIRSSKVTISTFSFTAVISNQSLQAFVLGEFECIGMEKSAISLLQIWCQSCDFQSCGRFLSDLLTRPTSEPVAHICLTHLKKSIYFRILKDWESPEPWNSLLELVLGGNRQNFLSFQLIAFIMRVLGTNVRIRLLDFQHLNEALVSWLKGTEELTKEVVKVCKYSFQICHCAAATQHESLQSSLLLVAWKLQIVLQRTASPSLKGLFAVLFGVVLRCVGEAYRMETVLEFVRSFSAELQKAQIQADLLCARDWEKAHNSSLSPFRKSDFLHFHSLSVPLRLPTIDLSNEIQNISPVRNPNIAHLPHTNPTTLPLLDSFQSSAVHTSDFSPSRHRGGDSSARTADVQVEFMHIEKSSTAWCQ